MFARAPSAAALGVALALLAQACGFSAAAACACSGSVRGLRPIRTSAPATTRPALPDSSSTSPPTTDGRLQYYCSTGGDSHYRGACGGACSSATSVLCCDTAASRAQPADWDDEGAFASHIRRSSNVLATVGGVNMGRCLASTKSRADCAAAGAPPACTPATTTPAPPNPPPQSPSPPAPQGSIPAITGRFPDYSQNCRDDAGQTWADEWEGSRRYYDDHPSAPVLKANGECAGPVKAACEARGAMGKAKAAKAAYLEGPVQCGGRGWFCRIVPDKNWGYNYGDYNFNHCNATDYGDTGGHCHGSDDDSTYYWWVRDHFNRGYAGHLKCCCDWEATKDIASRCDYRAMIPKGEASKCRDANEDHTGPKTGFSKGYEAGCSKLGAKVVEPPNDQCWEVTQFAFNDPDRARMARSRRGQ